MMSIFGHDAQRAELLHAAAGERMHHGWLLAGPEGIGKAGLARQIVRHLLAGDGGNAGEDGQTAHLLAAGSHPDFAELVRLERDNGELARNIGVDQVRRLHRLLDSAPAISRRRVILIDSADDLERGGANALLKSLEEPPADTIFLLVTHAPSRLLPTIRSRCRTLRFAALGEADMRRALCAARPDLASDELDHMVRLGRGSPGRALALAGAGIAELSERLIAVAAGGDPDNSLRLALAGLLSPKGAKARYEAFLRLVPAFIADAARTRTGVELARALALWEEARAGAEAALPLTLNPATVVFGLASLVAGLHEDRPAAVN